MCFFFLCLHNYLYFTCIGFKKHPVEQVKYVPPELVACASNDSRTLYHCYLLELEPDFNYNIKPQNIILALRTRPEFDDETSSFNLDVNNGSLKITLRYHSAIELNPEEVKNPGKMKIFGSVLICATFMIRFFSVRSFK